MLETRVYQGIIDIALSQERVTKNVEIPRLWHLDSRRGVDLSMYTLYID